MIAGLISPEISSFYKNIILGLYISSAVLSLGSLKSLNETSYTGVMAATGLSYLSLLVSLGGTGTLILLTLGLCCLHEGFTQKKAIQEILNFFMVIQYQKTIWLQRLMDQ